jgi:uncharacterized protein YuzE
LTRYRDFHINCEALVHSDPEHEIHKELAREYAEAVIKQNMIVNYDREYHILSVTWGASPHKKSNEFGKYILDIGEDGSIIGIKILNMYL